MPTSRATRNTTTNSAKMPTERAARRIRWASRLPELIRGEEMIAWAIRLAVSHTTQTTATAKATSTR